MKIHGIDFPTISEDYQLVAGMGIVGARCALCGWSTTIMDHGNGRTLNLPEDRREMEAAIVFHAERCPKPPPQVIGG